LGLLEEALVACHLAATTTSQGGERFNFQKFIQSLCALPSSLPSSALGLVKKHTVAKI
jgi:hypothetical protein